jgi:hypothetical protein
MPKTLEFFLARNHVFQGSKTTGCWQLNKHACVTPIYPQTESDIIIKGQPSQLSEGLQSEGLHDVLTKSNSIHKFIIGIVMGHLLFFIPHFLLISDNIELVWCKYWLEILLFFIYSSFGSIVDTSLNVS